VRSDSSSEARYQTELIGSATKMSGITLELFGISDLNDRYHLQVHYIHGTQGDSRSPVHSYTRGISLCAL